MTKKPEKQPDRVGLLGAFMTMAMHMVTPSMSLAYMVERRKYAERLRLDTYSKNCGEREKARRRRQIVSGQLRAENGLALT